MLRGSLFCHKIPWLFNHSFMLELVVSEYYFCLINVLDPKAAGAMVEAIQEDGKPTWLNQIRGRFLHPTDESFTKYASVSLGTAQAAVNEPVHEVLDDDAEIPVDSSAQVESRKKRKADKPEKGEKRVEGKTAGTFRERPSTLPFLDYGCIRYVVWYRSW
ncbi:hypothetical protein HanIR_Chr14g0674921 [Helianthus annuus]|nr:hypothetical protein HanIR_Chr14g0674921 [Helianthus annuus]